MARSTQDLQGPETHPGGRQRVLSAASELFRTNTLAGTSLQMIADRLGVTKAAIYHHFKSRDEIVQALMAPVLADAAAGVARLAALASDERGRAAREFYADFVVAHRQVISVMFFDLAALDPASAVRVDELVSQVAAALATADADAARAGGEVLVYGVAALVARRPALEDDELRALVEEVLGTRHA